MSFKGAITDKVMNWAGRSQLAEAIPQSVRATLALRTTGFLKIPLIFWVAPTVLELSPSQVSIRIPLNRRTKNHLGSMYFAVMAVGADIAGGLIAWKYGQDGGKSVSLVFKDFHADFLKRPLGDTVFTCEDGDAVRAAIERARRSGERENLTVNVTAIVPSVSDEPVARFKLTLSLKARA